LANFLVGNLLFQATRTNKFGKMLAVDRKKTDKVDLVKPIQQYVRNQYSAQAVSDHTEAFNYLQQLREDTRNLQDKNDATKDLLVR
jgi:hypothetical protein